MKHLILAFCIYILSISSYSQTSQTLVAGVYDFGENYESPRRMFVNWTVYQNIYFDKNFTEGKVQFSDDIETPYDMRYDILHDRMEARADSNKDIKILPLNHNWKIHLNNRIFELVVFGLDDDRNGYYELVADIASDFKLLIKHDLVHKDSRQRSAPRTSFELDSTPNFIYRDMIYFKDGMELIALDNKKSVFRDFDKEYRGRVKNFIEERNLEFDSKFNDLKEVLVYYESIRNKDF
jgi:hypothetical protein